MIETASTLATVYVIFADGEEAARIGKAMVEARLAACVNILAPCRSIYWWEGALEESHEVPALFKTRADLAPALTDAVAAVHSYENPAIIVWPITLTTVDYGRWIMDETGHRNSKVLKYLP